MPRATSWTAYENAAGGVMTPPRASHPLPMSRRWPFPRFILVLAGLALTATAWTVLSSRGWLGRRIAGNAATAQLNAAILLEAQLALALAGLALIALAFLGNRLGPAADRPAGPLTRLDAWLRTGRRWQLIVIGAATLTALVFAAYSIGRHNAFNSKAYDLGLHAQVIWNTSQGRLFASSVEVDNYLGDHVSPMILLLAPLYWLWPDPRALLIVQATAVAAGALPLAWLARRLLQPHWPSGAHLLALLLALAYLASPALGFTNRFEFHEEVLAVPLLLLAYWWLETEQPWRMSAALLLALWCKEDVGLTVAAFGVWVAWRRPRLRAVGTAWAVIGAAWSLTALLVIIPAFRGAASDTLDRYAWLGRTPAEALATLIRRPGAVLGHLLGDPRRFWFLFKLLLPTGFLALLSPAVLVTLPGLLVNWLAGNLYQATFYFHYAAVLIPVVFAAAAYGLERVAEGEETGRRERREKRERRKRGERWERWETEVRDGEEVEGSHGALGNHFVRAGRWPLVMVWLVGCVVLALALDQFWQRDFGVANWENYGLAKQIDPAPFWAAAALLPADGVVATTEAYAPHLANRQGLHLLHDPRIGQVVDRLDWVLVDLSDHRYGVNPKLYYALLRWVAKRRGLEVCFFDGDVVLLGRNCAEAAATAAYRARLADLQRSVVDVALDPAVIDAVGRQYFEP